MSIDPSKECVVKLPTGHELRTPAHPKPCVYVRIVDSVGNERVYWDSLEWQEDPEGVMGAIVGAMKGDDSDPQWDVEYTREKVRVCPDCSSNMRAPLDPDCRATYSWRCPACGRIL